METNEILELKNSLRNVLSKLERIIFEFRRQRFYQGLEESMEVLDVFAQVLEKLGESIEKKEEDFFFIDIENLLVIFQELKDAQEKQDYVLLTDIYELKLKILLEEIEGFLMEKLGVFIEEEIIKKNIQMAVKRVPQLVNTLFSEKIIEESTRDAKYTDETFSEIKSMVERLILNGIVVEPTSCGYYTLAIQNNTQKYYLHTNGNVVSEAVALADEWLQQNKEKYHFFGFGMGYPYMEMLSKDFNIEINIKETNKDILIAAFIFSPISMLFENGNFSLDFLPEEECRDKLNMEITGDYGFYILYPVLYGIRNRELKEKIGLYFVNEGSIRSQVRSLNGNFGRNIKEDVKGLDDLKDNFFDKNVVIVAGGPSLDKNVMELKQKRKDIIVLAVGTVLKKLLHLGIKPDYTIIVDGNRLVSSQTEGIEDCGVPLIFLSTAFHPLVRNYNGERYIICQKGFLDAELYAKKMGWELIESGGSVSTAAMDLCIRLQVKRIIFIGLDLAYTNNMTHANDTPLQKTITEKVQISVPAVDGGKVTTGKNLKIYLEWIENRIKKMSGKERKIEIIDATEGGALIQGMRVLDFRDVLESIGCDNYEIGFITKKDRNHED